MLSIPVASHTHQENMKLCHWTGFLLCVSDDLTAHPLLWKSCLYYHLQSNTIQVRALNGVQVTLVRQCGSDWTIRFMLLMVSWFFLIFLFFQFFFFSSVMALWMPLWQCHMLDHHFSDPLTFPLTPSWSWHFCFYELQVFGRKKASWFKSVVIMNL